MHLMKASDLYPQKESRIYYASKFCMLLVVNHCKNHNVVIKFHFSRGCQNNILETKKNMQVLHCFLKQFLSVHNCASVYSLALYRQVFLVTYSFSRTIEYLSMHLNESK